MGNTDPSSLERLILGSFGAVANVVGLSEIIPGNDLDEGCGDVRDLLPTSGIVVLRAVDEVLIKAVGAVMSEECRGDAGHVGLVRAQSLYPGLRSSIKPY